MVINGGETGWVTYLALAMQVVVILTGNKFLCNVASPYGHAIARDGEVASEF